MTERLDTLKKARDRMVEERDAHAKVLAAPFDRDKAERARNKFVEIQTLIDSLDRAIGGEQIGSEPAAGLERRRCLNTEHRRRCSRSIRHSAPTGSTL